MFDLGVIKEHLGALFYYIWGPKGRLACDGKHSVFFVFCWL